MVKGGGRRRLVVMVVVVVVRQEGEVRVREGARVAAAAGVGAASVWRRGQEEARTCVR